MGSHNKLEKLEEKKKLELQLLKINYDLSSNEITRKKNEKVIIDDKNIKEIEKEFMELSNKFYTFEEKMKKNFIVKNKLNKNEFNKNEKMLLKYEKLNNEKTELFDAIQKFREYRDKAIEIKYDYDKLIEREMEILSMEKEREKRFKKQITKISKRNVPQEENTDKIKKSYKSNFEEIEKKLFVNYNARCNDYKNIKCTKYVFTYKDNFSAAANFSSNVSKYRKKALNHFMVKNNIQKKIKNKKHYSENLTIEYNIIERVVVKINKDNQEIIKTIKLIFFIEDYDQDLEVLE